MRKVVDITGKKFGKLMVIRQEYTLGSAVPDCPQVDARIRQGVCWRGIK
jgi:hypothetical protein